MVVLHQCYNAFCESPKNNVVVVYKENVINELEAVKRIAEVDKLIEDDKLMIEMQRLNRTTKEINILTQSLIQSK